MKLDLYRVVELFRKSFSISLFDREKEELDDVLQDDYLKEAYDQLSDETFVLDKFREFDTYEYRPAFNKLKVYRHHTLVRRWITWSSSVAAVLMLVFVFVYHWERQGKEQKLAEITQHIVHPGSNAAILKLTDGRTVEIGKQPLELKEAKGSVVKYENGRLSYSSGKEEAIKDVYNELIVPIGGECHVLLDDGTEVWLNAGSRLKYPVAFLGEKRKVIFSGEAFFEVKKDSRPFIVSMETGDVTVLGTSFGIRAYPGETDYTTLVTGKVCFQSKENESVILSPGEQDVLHLAGRLEKREVNVEEYVGWKDGLFVFRNETLSEIMKILGRWYGVNVIFLDDSLKELEYTGNLERYDSINTFLQLLKRLKEVHYEIKGNTVVLYK